MDQLRNIVAEKRKILVAASPYSEKDELNEFLGFCGGIICDGKILQAEVEAIRDRFRASDVLVASVPFAQLRRAVEAVLADHVVTEAEAREIEEWIAHLVGSGYMDTEMPNIGQVAILDAPITDPKEIRLSGSTFVLTGPMVMGPRSYIVEEIARVGGKYANTTTRGTDYVVVSSTASKNWRTTSFGTKIERAKELIEDGYKL
jgi:NAD-dependent DNA ligase